jgi:alpha-beta hydrolase superfamily lysophospholipase
VLRGDKGQARLTRAGVTGCVLCAPYFGSRIVATRWQAILARVADRVWPWLPVPTRFEADWLYADDALRGEDRNDRLANRVATPRWYLSTLRVQAEVMADAHRFDLPLLMLVGEDDPVADSDAAGRFFDRAGSPDKTCHRYAGLRHEPLRDARRETVFADLLAWLHRRAAAPTSPVAQT